MPRGIHNPTVAIWRAERGGRREYVHAGFGLGFLPRTPAALGPPDGDLRCADPERIHVPAALFTEE